MIDKSEMIFGVRAVIEAIQAAFVVNGKYLLKTASITSIDSMVDNIRELSKK